ncbi:unnamed protein product [[Candida] boidinii]|nr:unnamed protein product [[Candida] boidinii]
MFFKSLFALAGLAQLTFTAAADVTMGVTAAMVDNTPYFAVLLPTGYEGFAIGGISDSDFSWVKGGTQLSIDGKEVDPSSFNVLADEDKIELVYGGTYTYDVGAVFEATQTADASTLVDLCH